jgi:hypothetical protein
MQSCKLADLSRPAVAFFVNRVDKSWRWNLSRFGNWTSADVPDFCTHPEMPLASAALHATQLQPATASKTLRFCRFRLANFSWFCYAVRAQNAHPVAQGVITSENSGNQLCDCRAIHLLEE